MFDSIHFAPTLKAPVLVLACFKRDSAARAHLDKDSLRLDTDGAVANALDRGEATGELGRIVEAFPSPPPTTARRSAKARATPAHPRVIILGLGDQSSFHPALLRDAAAALGRRLAVTRDPAITLELAPALTAAAKATGDRPDLETAGAAFAEGLGLIAWTCDSFKGPAKKNNRPRLAITSSSTPFSAGLRKGLALAQSTNLARTLSQTPPNICTPLWIADQARKMAAKSGLRCTILKGDALRREHLTGLIEVGKASENKPCFIRLEYRPPSSSPRARAKPLVLIGKTVCYDTGGLSLKINNGMRGMKRDKDGGCTVLAAMHAIATIIKPRKPVVAILVAAENSVSDEAYRPDDIITFRNGVTAEITNTDAEGRLVLADALCWACDKESPAAIIDLATLTGGVVTALGSTFAGMWCDDDSLRAKLQNAADAAGERVWRLPHHEEYRDMMKSDVADIINSNPNRKAHPIQGAAFLSFFVKPSIPWCHLDIAGVHASDSDKGPFVRDSSTGWGVRLLAHLADEM